MTRTILAVVCIVLASCGSSGDAEVAGGRSATSDETAADALERQIGFIAKGQTERAYAEIHPAQQELFTQDQYSRCGPTEAASFDFEGIKVVDSYETTLTVAGTDLEVEAVAITAEVKMKGFDAQADTYREIGVNGEWRFTVSDPQELIDC